MTAGDRRLDPLTRCLVLGLPLAFLAHDIGEVRGNGQLNEALADLLGRGRFASRVAGAVQTTDQQIAVAVAALTAGCVAVSVRAAARPASVAAVADFATATALVGGHMIAHIAQSLVLRRPMPGLTGGLLVTVPYSAVVLMRLHRRGYIDPASATKRAAVGALALGPALLTLRFLARRVLR